MVPKFELPALKSKADAIAGAGIPAHTAYRHEERGVAVAKAAAEAHFAIRSPAAR